MKLLLTVCVYAFRALLVGIIPCITGCNDIDILDMRSLWVAAESDNRLNGVWQGESKASNLVLCFAVDSTSESKLYIGDGYSGLVMKELEFPISSIRDEVLGHDYLLVQFSITNVVSFLMDSEFTMPAEDVDSSKLHSELMTGKIAAYSISGDELIFFSLNPSALGDEIPRSIYKTETSRKDRGFNYSAQCFVPGISKEQLRYADANGLVSTNTYRFIRRKPSEQAEGVVSPHSSIELQPAGTVNGARQGQAEKIENSHSPGAEEQDQSR